MNQISGKISRFDWTCASERHGEQKVVRSPKPVGRCPGFKAYLSAQTNLGKALLIRVIVKVARDETYGLLGDGDYHRKVRSEFHTKLLYG